MIAVGLSNYLSTQFSVELCPIAVSIVPPIEYITLIGINEAGSPSSSSRFRKGAVAQPSMYRPLSYPNARGNVCGSEPLMMQFNDLRVAIRLLSAPPFLR